MFQILLGLGAGWTISLTLCIPPIFRTAPYDFFPGMGGCAPNFSTGVGALWYSALYTAFTLLLPATVIICCNLKVTNLSFFIFYNFLDVLYLIININVEAAYQLPLRAIKFSLTCVLIDFNRDKLSKRNNKL